jgi:hypothetical protein
MNKGHDGHDKNLIGSKLYSRRILFCTVYLRTVNVRIKIIYPDPLILHSVINSRFGDFVDRIYPIGF